MRSIIENQSYKIIMQIQAEVNSNELQLDLSVESPLIIPGLMVYVVADPKEVIIIDEDTENYPVHSIYGIALNRGDKSLRYAVHWLQLERFEEPWNDTWEPIKHLERMLDKVQDFQFAVFEYLLNNFLLGELSSIEETWFSKFQELQMHPFDEITELESQEREKGRLQKRARKSETLPKNIPMKKSTINVKDKKFCCRNCTKRYTTSSNLLRHANTVHRDTNASSNNSFNDQDVVVVISTLSANSSENTVDNRDLSSPTSESNCGENEILLEQVVVQKSVEINSEGCSVNNEVTGINCTSGAEFGTGLGEIGFPSAENSVRKTLIDVEVVTNSIVDRNYETGPVEVAVQSSGGNSGEIAVSQQDVTANVTSKLHSEDTTGCKACGRIFNDLIDLNNHLAKCCQFKRCKLRLVNADDMVDVGVQTDSVLQEIIEELAQIRQHRERYSQDCERQTSSSIKVQTSMHQESCEVNDGASKHISKAINKDTDSMETKNSNKKIGLNCKVCKKKFASRFSLKRHQETKHSKSDQSETCQNCQRTFSNTPSLQTHQRIKCGKYTSKSK